MPITYPPTHSRTHFPGKSDQQSAADANANTKPGLGPRTASAVELGLLVPKNDDEAERLSNLLSKVRWNRYIYATTNGCKYAL